MRLAESDECYVRELPVGYLWNGAEQYERDEAGDRRTILNPDNVDQWVSAMEWAEIDLSECD